MQPVIQEVVQQQAGHPDPDTIGGQLEYGKMRKYPCIDADRQHFQEHADDLAHDTQAQAVQRIVQAIGIAATLDADDQFYRDKQEKHRACKGDDFFLHDVSFA